MSILSLILLALTILLWIGVVAIAATINQSDAAGNGLSFSFGVLLAGALWILIAVLLLIVGLTGLMPRNDRFAALLLVPASGAAAIAAFNLLRVRAVPAVWPVAIIALAPALAIGFSVWASWPTIRARVAAETVSPMVWGMLLLLAIAPWPALIAHDRAVAIRRGKDAAETKAGEAPR
jgi:hypothetical protein